MITGVPLDPGSSVGHRFIFEEQIGRDELGVVFRARDLRMEQAGYPNSRIALRLLKEEITRQPSAVRAVLREARKAQTLSHPNIVTIYDLDRDDTNVYMTMELLEGEPLDQVIRRVAGVGVSLAEALMVIREICSAVGYAHSRGILHADFRPSNVFLTRQRAVKVLDFGIARAVRRGDWADSFLTLFDVNAPTALNAAYAGCEITEGKDPVVKDDIYAIACVFYELLTGKHPFGGRSAEEAFNADLRPARPAKLSRSQWRVLRRALEFRRDERPTSVLEFSEGLQRRRVAPAVYVGVAAAASIVVIGGLAAMRVMVPEQRAISSARAPTPVRAASTPVEKIETTSAPVPEKLPPPITRLDKGHASPFARKVNPEPPLQAASSAAVSSSAKSSVSNSFKGALQSLPAVDKPVQVSQPKATRLARSHRSGKRKGATELTLTPTSVESSAEGQGPYTKLAALYGGQPGAPSKIDALKQRLLTEANADQVDEALITLSALREHLPENDSFLVNDAPQAITRAYVRLASDAAKKGKIEDALNLANRGSHLTPTSKEATDARDRYLEYYEIDDTLRNDERIIAHHIRYKMWRVSKLAPDEMPAVKQRWARDFSKRIRDSQDPKVMVQLARTEQTIFGGDFMPAPVEQIAADATSSQ